MLKNKEDFSYSRLFYCGNIIEAGDPNELSVSSPDYEGFLTGFENLTDFKSFLNKKNDGSFIITER